MAKTKPVAKKATTKKTTAKKPVAKKATNVKAKSANAKTAKLSAGQPATRRPDPNLPPTVDLINALTNDVLYLITELSNYAANLRALDRQRHNGVGLRRLGFIEAAVGLRPLCGFAPAHFYVPFVKNYCGNY